MSTRGKYAVLVTKSNYTTLKKDGFEPELGKYLCLFCHYDNYPDRIIPILNGYFSGAKGALKLITYSEGNYMDMLEYDSVDYNDYGGQDFIYEKDPTKDLDDAEYLYYFDGKTWKCVDDDGKEVILEVRQHKKSWQLSDFKNRKKEYIEYVFSTEFTLGNATIEFFEIEDVDEQLKLEKFMEKPAVKKWYKENILIPYKSKLEYRKTDLNSQTLLDKLFDVWVKK